MTERNASIAILIGTMIIVGLCFVFGTVYGAKAHSPDRHDLDKWYSELKNGGGGRCCSGPDGTVLVDADWESHDGHYRVRIAREWVDVPDSAVIKGPNLDGRTIVWPLWINGKPTARCFMPGSMI